MIPILDDLRGGGIGDRCETTGTSCVADTTACAEGVAMATITLGFSPTNFCAICAAVAGAPFAVSNLILRSSPSLYPGLYPASSIMAVTTTDTLSAANALAQPRMVNAIPLL